MLIGVVMLISQVFCYGYMDFRGRTRRVTTHEWIVKEYYKHRLTWTTSSLGAVLYKNVNEKHIEKREEHFIVLVWKHWEFFKNRLAINHATNQYNPLHNCPVRNCEFTGDDSSLNNVDAVIVSMYFGDIPKTQYRNPRQRWIFFSDESPDNTFAGTKKKPNIHQMANLFNWSMTYRSDSDVPVPYGRTIPLPRSVFPPKKTTFKRISTLVPFWERKNRDILITVLMSHCIKHRMMYIKYLKKLIKIDFYGGCSYSHKSRKRCPGHFHSDCDVISNYVFYLVLENSSCRQYMTEKLFYNAYMKGAIPVIRNPMRRDCQRLLPPNSFIHIDNYGSPAQLADALKTIGADDKKILSFHAWRNHFRVTNEHGYFGSESFNYCRVCQALNYNNREEKIYDEDEVRLFLYPKILCNKIHENEFVSYRRFYRKLTFEEDNTTDVDVYSNLMNAIY